MMRGSNRVAALLGATLLLSVLPAAAQSWQGRANLELRVSSRKGGAVAGARVDLTYRDARGDAGPLPVATDTRGRAVITDLATGTWQVEVQHPDFMSFVAVVRLDTRDKPRITASFLQAFGSSSTPIQVKLGRAKKGQTASPPMPGVTRPAKKPAPPPPAAAAAPAPALVPVPAPTTSAPPATSAPETSAPAPETSKEEPAERAAPQAAAAREGTVPREPSSERPQVRENLPIEAPLPTTPEADAEPEPPGVELPAVDPPVVEAPATEPPSADPVREPPAAETPTPQPPAAIEPPPAPQPEETPPPTPEPEIEPPSASEPAPSEEHPALPEAVSPSPQPKPTVTTPPTTPPATTQPATTPPASKPPSTKPQPAPIPTQPQTAPAWRSHSRRTCPECRPGEWAVTVTANAAASGPCSDEVSSETQQTIAAVGGQTALELAAFAGSLDQALPLLGSTAAGQVSSALAAAFGGGCRVLAIVLPKGSRFVGFQYEIEDGEGRRPCLPDQPCPGETLRFTGPPRITRGVSATIIHALAHGTPAADTTALMTVFLRGPNSDWQPTP